MSDGNGARAFTYDVRNRLALVSAGAQTLATYTYNALGQRVRKVAGSTDVDYVYDLAGHLIGDRERQVREVVPKPSMKCTVVRDARAPYTRTDLMLRPCSRVRGASIPRSAV
jgi:YD repeat-containing protein